MVYEVVKVLRGISKDTEDLITIKQAANLSGRLISTISRMMDSGTLPEYRINNSMDGTRYTSRQAVAKLE